MFVTGQAAIHRSVLDQVRRNVVSSKSFKDEADALAEGHLMAYHRAMRAYYNFYAAKSSTPKQGQTTMGAFLKPPPPPVPFPMPKATGFRIGMGPQYLIDLFLKDFTERADYYGRCLAGLGGKAICGDHTFKTAKNVTAADGKRLYAAVWDMMNEWGQIISLMFTESKAMDEIAGALGDLYKAWEDAKAQVRFLQFWEVFFPLFGLVNEY